MTYTRICSYGSCGAGDRSLRGLRSGAGAVGSRGQGVTFPKPSWGGCFSCVLPRSEFLVFTTWSFSSFPLLPPWSSLSWAGGAWPGTEDLVSGPRVYA